MHPVVNASFLQPWRDGSKHFPQREPPPPDPDLIDGEEHFAVEAFRNHRWFRTRHLQYLVEFTGHPEEQNEWLFADDLKEDIDKRSMARLVEDYRKLRDLPRDFDSGPQAQAPTRSRGRR